MREELQREVSKGAPLLKLETERNAVPRERMEVDRAARGDEERESSGGRIERGSVKEGDIDGGKRI